MVSALSDDVSPGCWMAGSQDQNQVVFRTVFTLKMNTEQQRFGARSGVCVCVCVCVFVCGREGEREGLRVLVCQAGCV